MDRYRTSKKLAAPFPTAAANGPIHISNILSQVLAERYSNGFADIRGQDEKCFVTAELGTPVSAGLPVTSNAKLPQLRFRMETNSLLPAMTG